MTDENATMEIEVPIVVTITTSTTIRPNEHSVDIGEGGYSERSEPTHELKELVNRKIGSEDVTVNKVHAAGSFSITTGPDE